MDENRLRKLADLGLNNVNFLTESNELTQADIDRVNSFVSDLWDADRIAGKPKKVTLAGKNHILILLPVPQLREKGLKVLIKYGVDAVIPHDKDHILGISIKR